MSARLAQFIDGALDRSFDESSILGTVAGDRVPTQSYVGRSVPALQDEGLQAALLPERIVRGVTEKIVNTGLPDSSLDRVDDRRHAAMEFSRDLD